MPTKAVVLGWVSAIFLLGLEGCGGKSSTGEFTVKCWDEPLATQEFLKSPFGDDWMKVKGVSDRTNELITGVGGLNPYVDLTIETQCVQGSCEGVWLRIRPISPVGDLAVPGRLQVRLTADGMKDPGYYWFEVGAEGPKRELLVRVTFSGAAHYCVWECSDCSIM